MQLEKGKKYRIEELKLFPEWELENLHNENNIQIIPVGVSYTKGGIHVTQQILDSWTIEEIRPKLQTGYYTTEKSKGEVVYRVVVSEEGEVSMWVALDMMHPQPNTYNALGSRVSISAEEDLIGEGFIPCKISIDLEK